MGHKCNNMNLDLDGKLTK